MLTKLLWILVVIMAVISGTFYWYYNDTQERIAILNENIAKIEVSEQICKATVNSLIANQAKLNQEITSVNIKFADTRAQNSVLSKKLEKHDIGVLGAAKPALVGKIINKATDNASRCLELLSGATLTSKEQTATSANAFNSECPWLWTGDKQ